MPYIRRDRRRIPDALVGEYFSAMDSEITTGDLNYFITKLVHEWVLKQDYNYENLARAKSVMDNASAEFYRVVIAPYEDTKIEYMVNGPISKLDGLIGSA